MLAPEVESLPWEEQLALDDYAYRGYRPQKVAMDRFAQAKANNILSLPTGQGLLIKPPYSS